MFKHGQLLHTFAKICLKVLCCWKLNLLQKVHYLILLGVDNGDADLFYHKNT